MLKLTENQRAALDNIYDGNVKQRNHGHGAWRINGPSNPSVVGRVISMGLAAWGKSSGGEIPCLLTPSGRLARDS